MSSPLPELPLYIDSTMVVAFRQCPRKFYYEFILCRRPPGRQIDLVAGSAFAAALEAAYIDYFIHSHSHLSALRAAYLAFRRSWGDFDEQVEAPKSSKTFDRTFQAVIDYFDTYPFETDHVRPMLRHDGKPTFEFSFAVPLDLEGFPLHPSGHPFIYCGRFDAFGKHGDAFVIRDEKTTGKSPPYFWSDQWNLRNQFLGYKWAAERSGFQIDEVIVRGITIQKTQFHHVEAVKIYSDFLIDRFLGQLARDLHRIVDCYNSHYFDYDLGDACTAFGRPCAFMDPCSDPDENRWLTDFRHERWNPLDRTNVPVKEAA